MGGHGGEDGGGHPHADLITEAGGDQDKQLADSRHPGSVYSRIAGKNIRNCTNLIASKLNSLVPFGSPVMLSR